jgi:hypothetical protein
MEEGNDDDGNNSPRIWRDKNVIYVTILPIDYAVEPYLTYFRKVGLQC